MRNIFKFAIVGMTAALMAVIGSGPASADSGPVYACCGAGPDYGGSSAWFDSYGEHLYIKDTSKDGRSAVVRISYAGHADAYYWNPNGVGSVRDVNLAAPEGSYLQYQACTGEYGNLGVYYESCGVTAYDNA